MVTGTLTGRMGYRAKFKISSVSVGVNKALIRVFTKVQVGNIRVFPK